MAEDRTPRRTSATESIADLEDARHARDVARQHRRETRGRALKWAHDVVAGSQGSREHKGGTEGKSVSASETDEAMMRERLLSRLR